MSERRRKVRKQKKLDQQRAKGWRTHRRNVAVQYGCPTPQKRPFESRYVAERAMAHTWRVKNGSRLAARVYRCTCGAWHLTSRGR